MVFTKEQLQTGKFTLDQLNLIKELWHQPQLEDDPLFVWDPILNVRLRAVCVSGQIVDYPLHGWLLLDSDEIPIKFHLGQNTFWQAYRVLENP
jgi:hypothetical protein